MSLLYMLLLPLLLCVCRLVQSAPAAAPFLLATRKDLCAEWCSSSSTVSGLLLELFGCKYVAEPPPLLQSHTFLWMHLLAAAFAWLCSSSIIMNQFWSKFIHKISEALLPFHKSHCVGASSLAGWLAGWCVLCLSKLLLSVRALLLLARSGLGWGWWGQTNGGQKFCRVEAFGYPSNHSLQQQQQQGQDGTWITWSKLHLGLERTRTYKHTDCA